MVSTPFRNIRQIGSSPQVGVKIKKSLKPPPSESWPIFVGTPYIVSPKNHSPKGRAFGTLLRHLSKTHLFQTVFFNGTPRTPKRFKHAYFFVRRLKGFKWYLPRLYSMKVHVLRHDMSFRDTPPEFKKNYRAKNRIDIYIEYCIEYWLKLNNLSMF